MNQQLDGAKVDVIINRLENVIRLEVGGDARNMVIALSYVLGKFIAETCNNDPVVVHNVARMISKTANEFIEQQVPQ